MFLFFAALSPAFGFIKVLKSVNISNKICSSKIRYWYHKTQNMMLSLNPLKKEIPQKKL
jgi:hypothetical protein